VIRLALRVPRERSEVVLAELLELAPAGVEEIDVSDALVEYAVYGSPGELPDLPDLRAAAAGVAVEVVTSEVPDDWPERWKRFHRPVLIQRAGLALHVRPPWESSSREGACEIVIDPGQAFGTGAHATTRMCLELLLELAAEHPRRGAAVDVGAGSGVLAIAAARLGYVPVLALDNERESIEAIQANAAVNGVGIEARRFDLRREPLPLAGRRPEGGAAAHGGKRATADADGPVVLANLLRPLLIALADSMAARPAHLIASGLLREEAEEVAAAFTPLGLRERGRRERGEWAALWLSPGLVNGARR
jgi:ribosomal protein L11 methyltransferase